MSKPATDFVKLNSHLLNSYRLYHFEFVFTGNPEPFPWDCVAKSLEEAWVIAAYAVSSTAKPLSPACITINYRGRE